MDNTMIKNAVAVPVFDYVLLPGVDQVLRLQEPADELATYFALGNKTAVVVPLKHNVAQGDTNESEYRPMGIVMSSGGVEKNDKGTFLKARLLEKVDIKSFSFQNHMVYVEYSDHPADPDISQDEQQQMLDYMKNQIREFAKQFQGSERYMGMLDQIHDLNSLMTYLGNYSDLSAEDQYELLATDSLRERSLHFIDLMMKQKERIELNMELNERISEKSNQYYREQVLREQLKAIEEELGETTGGSASIGSGSDGKDSYEDRIKAAGMPEDIEKAAMEEVEKLKMQGPGSAEESVIRNYLDFMLKLPWKKTESKDIDLNEAERILNADHYGLDKVKERILQHLAVMKMKKDKQGSILLLVGPPGTGKTSLGRSIAKALGRKYVRISLGGIRDESEIRGHRRTYVGAMPGRILQSIKQAGTTNPVMVLDEVDKLQEGGFAGDPSSALLEVLDPEQNSTFTDHYLDLPYDLSDVFFIATANTLETIPAPLLDRMEVIQISSYTDQEKFHIGTEHLLGEVLDDTGLTADQLVIEDDTMRRIISDYTMEGGVRGLKKQLATIARSAAQKLVSGKAEAPITVKPDDLEEILGRKVSYHEKIHLNSPAGVVTGLAWTQVGGEILFIETTAMPGSGQIILTGQLGDVMKESARIAVSLLKSRLPLNAAAFKEQDIHIHVPAGATPKDGPSAGITLFTALASLFTGIKVDPHIAMTGEISLSGAVLPIGGLKEKLIAADRAGITKVLIPKENEEDLRDVPEEVRGRLNIIPVETVEDVLRETIHIKLPRPEHVFLQNADGSSPFGSTNTSLS